jgi:hypothetical protein
LFQKKFEIMKNIKTLLIILLGVLSLGIKASDTLYVRFNNYYVKDGGANNDTLVFDVEYKSFTAGTYIFACQNDIAFNTTVFGNNAKPKQIQNLGLIGPAMTIAVGPTNPTTSRFKYAISQLLPPYNPASLSLVPTATWGGLIRYKMEILNNTQNAGLQFLTGAGAMAGNQKFVKVLTSTGSTYVPIVAKNNLLNFPTTPTEFALMLSEIADPAGSNADFVELYNSGGALDLTGTSWYLTTYNGSTYSSVKLTGYLSAGQSYVIGGSSYSYPGKPATITSSIVDGSGTLSHFLTFYDPYPGGTLIDYYGGAGTAYTGCHAVRLYNVAAPNTTFTAAEWSILPAGNLNMTPGSHIKTASWQGDVSSDWLDNNNWTNGYIPDAGHVATITNGGETTPVIGFGDNAATYDLTIGGGVSGLTIQSDASVGDGSLVTYGTVSGLITVQRYLGADRYYYITKPVTSANSGVFLHCWLFTYNELINDWDPFIEPETTPLGNMKGYAVWTSSENSYYPGVIPPIGDTTVAYVGTLNTGAQTKALTYSIDGWNFTGNPYPSAVDWTAAGWTKTNLSTNAYSVWNGTSYGTYTTGSGGTNGATQFIPAAQGFFVQTTAAGSLGLTNAVRTHATLDFWKSEELMANRLSLTISNGQVIDETVIYFNENASTDIDYAYDASKLIASAAPQAYTMLGERKMAINTFNNPGETPAVNMGISAPEAGEYTISASNLESFDASTPIFLEDLLSGQYINLRETSSYSFSSEAGMSARFVVHFTNTQGIGDQGTSEVNGIYSVDRNVYVNFNGKRGEISLYNLLGQEVSRTSATNGLNVIAAPQGNAVYIVKVISDNVSVTKKVFVK